MLPELRTAESLLGSGVYSEPLGFVTGPIQRGWYALLYGARYCNVLAEQLSFTAQLPVGEGGLASRSIVVDAGNSFDPYYVSHLASERGLEPQRFLHGVIVSRAFNAHQLMNLVVNELPRAIEESRVGLVSILNPVRCFEDSELEPGRKRRKMAATLADALSDIAYRQQVALVVTLNDDDHGGDESPLARVFLKRADVAVRFRKDGTHRVRAELVKHPFTQKKVVLIDWRWKK